MTIEELAAEAQVATTTVRMYQAKGLLPGPRRDGRIGRYGPGHLARLRLIARLQDRGFSLAAIQQLVESWEAGHSLDDILGFEQRLPGIVGSRDAVGVTLDELIARFPPGALTGEVMERARAQGLVSAGDDGMLSVSRTFLDVGATLAAIGVPVVVLLAEQATLDATMDDVAARFVDVFQRHLRQRFPEEGIDDAQLRELAGLLEQLSDLARRVVDASLRAALSRAAEQVVADEAPRLVQPATEPG